MVERLAHFLSIFGNILIDNGDFAPIFLKIFHLPAIPFRFSYNFFSFIWLWKLLWDTWNNWKPKHFIFAHQSSFQFFPAYHMTRFQKQIKSPGLVGVSFHAETSSLRYQSKLNSNTLHGSQIKSPILPTSFTSKKNH